MEVFEKSGLLAATPVIPLSFDLLLPLSITSVHLSLYSLDLFILVAMSVCASEPSCSHTLTLDLYTCTLVLSLSLSDAYFFLHRVSC